METTPTPATEKLPRVLEIEGVHPAEYATWWGDGSTADGNLFYDCSFQARPGRVTANPDWSAEDWRTFAAAVRRQLAEVQAEIAEPGARDTGWTGDDADSLEKLLRWASDLAERGPQTFTVTDESGREIVRISELDALECSGAGDQSGNVADVLADKESGIVWLGSADDIRRHLKHSGAWDVEELKDDAANRERALWMACNDVAENPEDSADL